MGILNPFKKEFDKKTVQYTKALPKNLLLIFTRNPELGKCKTRLAATVGDESALDIYKFLLEHTVNITKNLDMAKQVWYSEEIWRDDVWDNPTYDKKRQGGSDLGVRMANAFTEGFAAGFEKICIIGSDMYDLKQQDIAHAFAVLSENDFVIGPAEDGGYYLLGMTRFKNELFQDKNWGNDSVLSATITDLANEKVHLLPVRNDVDVYTDIAQEKAFEPYLKHMK
ncbi:glycosyltransferase [Aggregatimonas sangjinii]|uniref:Glycosyltransferase n=1 Tax=Aggregatimonas sangjinii TaxID=2583587 RepID=A0A5B7SPZ6_9FLAO|nr:TIGR04282 family arsenosugar biosynthesis glycosyltransferase [Aggregatimonas sangjinii]QCW98703.1 glycosyltransferase [Aggregatimonas sangjinii]